MVEIRLSILTHKGDSQSVSSGGRSLKGMKKLSMCSTQTLTLMFSKYSFKRMAVVVLPLPDGPVSVTTGRSLREDKMVAAAALILS